MQKSTVPSTTHKTKSPSSSYNGEEWALRKTSCWNASRPGYQPCRYCRVKYWLASGTFVMRMFAPS